MPDDRQQKKLRHQIHDSLMSGFAMMFFQDPSLLQFQKSMKEAEHRSNLETLFGVSSIPKDTQMRDIIDGVSPENLRPVFSSYFARLQRGKHLEQYQIFPGLYLMVGDGSQYFGSNKIHCPACLKRKHRNGETGYAHQILQAAMVHPDKREVIPLMPEEIRNTDGTVKQDCEMNAGKRLIGKIRKDHPQLGIIFGGDGLYSKQPFIQELLKERMHFILVAKPDDHKVLMKEIEKRERADELKRMTFIDEKNRRHLYEWTNLLPLNGNQDTIQVNYFRYYLIVMKENGEEKITYKNSWVTDLEITNENIQTLVRAGRARWKIENECFNNLKNHGYHIEHNYGHGKKHLSFNFLLLTLLAFFFHQIYALTQELYQACRKKFGSKRHMWETLRSYIKIFIFESWEQLLSFALNPTSFNPRLDSS